MHLKGKHLTKSTILTNTLSLVFIAAIFAWGCNQGSSGEEENTENEQPTQADQGQAPAQPQQNVAPMQPQPGQATEVNEEELRKFADVAQQIQLFNQEIQQKMISAVERNGLEAQRYGEIQQAQQNSQQPPNLTKEERQKFDIASRELQKIQTQAQQEMQKKITDADLTMARFQEISMTLQRDSDLQARFQILQQQSQ